MPSPFPGMNPYLEQPGIWQGIHKWLIMLIAEKLNPQLRPQYRAAIEERVYENKDDNSVLVGIPDDVIIQTAETTTKSSKSSQTNVAVAAPPTQPVTVTIPLPETVKEWYLEVRAVGSGKVITVIEILSPKNKRAGEGRNQYERKRQKILGSSTHLIEIDLLRGGKEMPMDSKGIKTDYRILVSRSQTRPSADLYAFNLQSEIPIFPLPLAGEDPEPKINLQELLHQAYDRGSYDLVVDYTKEPAPALLEADAAWAAQLLAQQGLSTDN
ncbi:MAG: DUF4058 family protein [Kamptonema sp. SIO1D9]|nr:DUF4058 family protein [Kamptonema sp. SIO1D9]